MSNQSRLEFFNSGTTSGVQPRRCNEKSGLPPPQVEYARLKNVAVTFRGLDPKAELEGDRHDSDYPLDCGLSRPKLCHSTTAAPHTTGERFLRAHHARRSRSSCCSGPTK